MFLIQKEPFWVFSGIKIKINVRMPCVMVKVRRQCKPSSKEFKEEFKN